MKKIVYTIFGIFSTLLLCYFAETYSDTCTKVDNHNFESAILKSNTAIIVCENKTASDKKLSKTVYKHFYSGKTDSLSIPGAEINVGSACLKEEKTLSITPLLENDLPQLSAGLVNVTGGASGYRFLPHGEHFVNYPATVSIKYDTLKFPAGYSQKDVRTYFYNEQKKIFPLLTLIPDSVCRDLATMQRAKRIFLQAVNL